jgi:small-conductance mechanosensitive channel
MTLYAGIVFIHAATMLLFFIAHGASMAVAFRLKRERDPAAARALLDLSTWAMGWPTGILVIVGLASGIAVGIMGGWFGQVWIWASLVLFIAVALAMTPMASSRLRPMRAAAGTVPFNPFSRTPVAAPEPDPAELSRLLDAWNPVPIASLGIVSFLVILWLMLFKPF